MISDSWFVKRIKEDALMARHEKFYGSISFKLNFLDGDVKHMNISINKCVKEEACQDTGT
jgi:hypothetical protein